MPEPLERRVDDLKRSPAAQRRCDRALDSFIDLVLEGNLPPTPQQIAERAGISIATFFRYFENLNAMRQQAAERMRAGAELQPGLQKNQMESPYRPDLYRHGEVQDLPHSHNYACLHHHWDLPHTSAGLSL